MTTLREGALEAALEALLEEAEAAGLDEHEHERARSAFAAGRPRSAPLERRADEWFLLERHSPALGGVPAALALQGELELGDEHREALLALVGSVHGIFEVSGVQAGEGVWVRDLLTSGQYALEEPLGSRSLEEGDLLAGRLFPVGEGLHRISRAAGVFRSERLRAALESDLGKARSSRRGVLRLSGLDLERMLFGPGEPSRDDSIAAAKAALAASGLGEPEVEEILARLAREPFDGSVLPGASDALGEVLSELAFDTAVDLEAVRAALIELWPRLAPAAEPPGREGARERAASRREAIEAFERGRREGRDLEQLFRELERDLDLEEDADPERDEPKDVPDDARAPDFPGVVGAVIEEYLWELGRERAAGVARSRELLARLSAFAAPIGLFEELGGQELAFFAALWLPERGDLADAAEARELCAALEQFCAWVEQAQDLPLARAHAERVAPIAASLPRIVAANRALAPQGDPPGSRWFEVLAVEGELLWLGDGRRRSPCAVPAAVARELRAGDSVRAVSADGGLHLVRAYPREARELALRSTADA